MLYLKYTKSVDHLIVRLIPYIERYIQDYKNEKMVLYATDVVCEIIGLLFGNNVEIHKLSGYSNNRHLNDNVLELDTFISQLYDVKIHLILERPLRINGYSYLCSKEFICVYPKLNKTESFHNIDSSTFDKFIKNNKFGTKDVYIVGHQFERLNTKIGKDIDNFADSVDHISKCKLFITSESQWHYIALLCNCRNIIVYASNYAKEFERIPYDGHIIPDDPMQFNPFNNNIYITNDLLCTRVFECIQKIMTTK